MAVLRNLITAVRHPRLGLLLLTALHLASLTLFIHGFLLTRVHLAERSGPTDRPGGGNGTAAANQTAPAPFDRVVWLMIDALRYDFVITDGRYGCGGGSMCHQGHMPFLAGLSREPAARAFMFVSDAPTTTTQRLKSMVTGSLPSFFDVSNSFTAGAVTDDNLIDQLAAAGHHMAFLGDTTWQQLFPTQWAWSRPYPCFNVRDLHTVDDAVAEHLLPALRQAGGWSGLLVAHYLGVDHCGHTYGVGSQEMAQKLGQMDEQVRQVVDTLLQQAGPGGAYERTLLLVSGDHGQTLGGDHGGGSPEEVDSALVAVNIGALYDSRRHLRQAAAGGRGNDIGNAVAMEAAGAGAAAQAVGSVGHAPTGLGASAPCRAKCTCGVEGNQCVPDLAQLDLTPSLATLLGVPIPFGNMGKLSAELWQLTAARTAGAGTSECSTDAGSHGAGVAEAVWERNLADALMANAGQVHRYLNTYAVTPGTSFSREALGRLNSLYANLTSTGPDQLAVQVTRCYAYLEAAASVAREQWTQFGDLSMAGGLALFAATLALHAAAAFGSGSRPACTANEARSTVAAMRSAANSKAGRAKQPAPGWLEAAGQQLQAWRLVARWRPGHWLAVPTWRAWLAAMVLLHGLGIFSFFYLLSEGKMVCYLVAACCAALALGTGRATRAAGKGVRGVFGLSAMALRCNALMAVLGVAHHTGQGFWARLTVHDPQPADDVERGWQAKLAAAKALAAQVMARSGVDRLPPGVLLVAQHTLLCTLPILFLALLTERVQRGSSGGGGGTRSKGAASSGAVARLQRLLQWAAFASVAAYLQVEEATKAGLVAPGMTLRQLAHCLLWPLLPPGLTSTAYTAAAAAAQPVLLAWPAAGLYADALLKVPLRTLLPHCAYALCGVAAAAWLLLVATAHLRGAAAATAAARLLLALLLQVSDRQAPLTLLLAALELVAVAKLLGRRADLMATAPAAAAPPSGAGSTAGAAPSAAPSSGGEDSGCARGGDSSSLDRARAVAGVAGVAGEAAALVGLVSAQLFFVTGHLCEFAGLQYTAGFVGSDEFHLWRSGTLLALNTFGGMLLAVLALPAILQHVHAAGAGGISSSASSSRNTSPPAAGVALQHLPHGAGSSIAQPLLVAGLVRAAAAFCATLSAGVQRRHLYAWALFAPKFAFEACFLLLTDLVLLFLAALS